MDASNHIFFDQRRNRTLHVFFYYLFPLIASWVMACSVLAFQYQPDRQVTIDTEFIPASLSQSTSRKIWYIRRTPEKAAPFVTLSIYPVGADVPFCSMEIPSSTAPGTITLTDLHGHPQRSSDNGLFILPGYPAPVNVLPVNQPEIEKFYDEKRTAGGRVFVKRYRVFFESVSRETALKNGWITETSDPDTTAAKPSVQASGLPGESKIPGSVQETRPLRMVTVEDDSKTPVVRQLWRDGDSWWIYEETPFKRSRRVE